VKLQLATEVARLITRYNAYTARFFDIFKMRDHMATFFLPGNHDIGCVLIPFWSSLCDPFPGHTDSENLFLFRFKQERGIPLTSDHEMTRFRLETILSYLSMPSHWLKKILSEQNEGTRMTTGLQLQVELLTS
jgi:hypothetical protein